MQAEKLGMQSPNSCLAKDRERLFNVDCLVNIGLGHDFPLVQTEKPRFMDTVPVDTECL